VTSPSPRLAPPVVVPSPTVSAPVVSVVSVSVTESPSAPEAAAPPPPPPRPPAPTLPEAQLEAVRAESMDAPREEPVADASDALDDEIAESVRSVKRALRERDLAALDLHLMKLRVTGERERMVERLSGLLALLRGDVPEAVRRLSIEVELCQMPIERTQARLAYAVALAAHGRLEAALLAALDALARAREDADAQGERVCARLLARLSSMGGDAQAASAWAYVAARGASPG